MKTFQSGSFHNLEFPIMIAVVGVSLAIAIPWWQDIGMRIRVEDGIALAHPARETVGKIFAAEGPADMARQVSGKWAPPAPTADVQSVTVTKDGVITVRFSPKISAAEESQIQIVPVAAGDALDLSDPANRGKAFTWQCAGNTGKSTLAPKWVPRSCRVGKGSARDERWWPLLILVPALVIAWVIGWAHLDALVGEILAPFTRAIDWMGRARRSSANVGEQVRKDRSHGVSGIERSATPVAGSPPPVPQPATKPEYRAQQAVITEPIAPHTEGKWARWSRDPVFWCAMAVAILYGFDAWRDQNLRSRVTTGIRLAAPARDAVAKAFAEQGPADMSALAAARWAPQALGNTVQSIAVSKGGAITIRYTEEIAAADRNQLQIVPVADARRLDLSDPANRGRKFQWQCGGANGYTTVPAELRPQECR